MRAKWFLAAKVRCGSYVNVNNTQPHDAGKAVGNRVDCVKPTISLTTQFTVGEVDESNLDLALVLNSRHEVMFNHLAITHSCSQFQAPRFSVHHTEQVAWVVRVGDHIEFFCPI